jgi:signal transduction histidine kinase
MVEAGNKAKAYLIPVYIKSLHPDARLAFISPCLAKRREFQDSQMVEYNVTYQSLHKIFTKRGIDLSLLEDGCFDNTVSAGMAANFSTPGGLKDCYLNDYPSTKPSSINKIEGPLVYEKYLLDLENDIKAQRPDLPLIVDILSCEKGCNMGAGCINRYRSINNLEIRMATYAENADGNDFQRKRLKSFIEDALTKFNFDYNAYRDLSNLNQIKIPSGAEFKQIYNKMHKSEEKDFRNCAACGYNSCQNMAIAIFNGLNKVENCHLFQEKELRQEQEILNNMVDELEALNTQLQEEFNERKHQEQMLIQNSKLAAMGEMIGMIAHQWRQPLSSISTLAGNLKVLIELDMFDNEQFNSLLGEINQHAQYLSHTINDFRHFFKPDNPQDTVLLDDVVDNTLGIIGKSLEYKHVKLIKNYAFTNPILTYPNELMQVFMNILKNASDVFAENNTVQPQIIIHGYEKDGYQIVDIADNGGGIPEEIMGNIFDPYFSTKGPSVGTGLGLYMSKIIVEEHCHGRLYARNVDNVACFTIELPL